MFLTGFLLATAIWLPVLIIRDRYHSRSAVKKIQTLIEVHRKDWEEMIHKLNHAGTIPNSATATGLIGLILWAIGNSIHNLKMLFEKKDWNTQPVITELQQIAVNELSLLHKTLGQFLEAQRNILKEYQYKQEHNEEDKP